MREARQRRGAEAHESDVRPRCQRPEAARSPVVRDISVDQAPKTGNPSPLEGGRQDKGRAARLIFFMLFLLNTHA